MYFKTVESGGSGRVTEKRSRFIADVFYVSSQEEAEGHIGAVRKKYNDARHHCWAYVIKGAMDEERFSDDGEPAGTAGRPILDVIKGEGLKNVLIVVTRYFGGILLGTGGLVRAYTKAAREGISRSAVRTAAFGFAFEVKADYADLAKVRFILKQGNIPVLDEEYADTARLTVFVPEEGQGIIRKIDEATAGKAKIRRGGEYWHIGDLRGGPCRA